MEQCKSRWIAVMVSAFVLAACKTAPVSEPSSAPVAIPMKSGDATVLLYPKPVAPAPGEPAIISRMVRNGKGVPNGRSDGESAYFKTFKLHAATDKTYGYTEHNPVRTGPIRMGGHILFLNSLRDPNGEPIVYERRGACCRKEDAASPTGYVILDVYDLQFEGADKKTLLYVDVYRPGAPYLPIGLTQRAP